MSEPEDGEALKEKLAKLEPFERWKVEVSGHTQAYEKATSITRQKVAPLRKRLEEVESSLSHIIEEAKADKLQELYEKMLRLSLHSTVRVDEKVLRPRSQHRRLRAELEQMFSSGKISGEQYKDEVGRLFKLEQAALEFEDEMEVFYETSHYFEAIVSQLLSRLRYIRETESQEQLTALNTSLHKMTERLLLYTSVIAAFSVLTFVVILIRG